MSSIRCTLFAAACLLTWTLDAPARSEPPGAPARTRFAEKIHALVNAIEAHHVDSPEQDRLLASGASTVCEAAGLPSDEWEQLALDEASSGPARKAFLLELFDRASAKGLREAAIIQEMGRGIFDGVPGSVDSLSADEAKVSESLSATGTSAWAWSSSSTRDDPGSPGPSSEGRPTRAGFASETWSTRSMAATPPPWISGSS